MKPSSVKQAALTSISCLLHLQARQDLSVRRGFLPLPILLPANYAPACLASHVQCNKDALASASHPILLQKTEIAPFGKKC